MSKRDIAASLRHLQRISHNIVRIKTGLTMMIIIGLLNVIICRASIDYYIQDIGKACTQNNHMDGGCS
jgi:hypothetical protein